MPGKHLQQIFSLGLITVCLGIARGGIPLNAAEVTAHLVIDQSGASPHKESKAPPAIIWLKPTGNEGAPGVVPANFTLLQKNKMFTPHLLVIPVGSSVTFPNADPFFHNVFSQFDGKRFDLGLYEAGSSRSVVFPREGVSYIFCNIHSEMSAVVISLTTPFYAIADRLGDFHLKDVPDGDYELHVWVEGQHQNALEQQTRRVHITGDAANLGIISAGPPDREQHLNKFGRPYEPETRPIY